MALESWAGANCLIVVSLYLEVFLFVDITFVFSLGRHVSRGTWLPLTVQGALPWLRVGRPLFVSRTGLWRVCPHLCFFKMPKTKGFSKGFWDSSQNREFLDSNTQDTYTLTIQLSPKHWARYRMWIAKPGLVKNEQNNDLNLHCSLSVFINANKRMCHPLLKSLHLSSSFFI